jgi:hypothetical protein
VRVLLDTDVLAEIDDLERQLQQAVDDDEREDRMDRSPKAKKLAQRIVELQAQAREAERVFVFRSIGYRAWRDLQLEHPPTDEQLAKSPELDVNPDTFTSVAIAASCVQPTGVTVDKVRQLEDILTGGQYLQLWTACAQANARGSQIPNSLAASAVLRRSGRSSRQRRTTGSREASS